MAEQKAGGYSTKYRFTGKEVDEETGLYYFGARYYDPRISLWYGVDPLAEKYPSWNPYNYTLNNPISLIDPTGGGVEWIPKINNGKIVLLAEAGDNRSTLQKYLKGSRYESHVDDMWNSRKHNIGTHVLLPENNYSRAIQYSNENSSEFSDLQQKDDPLNYNCYHFAINGVWEKEIYKGFFKSYGDPLMDLNDAKNVLDNFFKEVTPDKAIVGETIIGMNYSKDSNVPQHVGVYAGTDSKGEIYILNKSGNSEKPALIKLKDAGSGLYNDFRFYNEKNAN